VQLPDTANSRTKLETQNLLQLGMGPMNMACHPDGHTLLTANHDAGSLPSTCEVRAT
jgi:hypothetical protein